MDADQHTHTNGQVEHHAQHVVKQRHGGRLGKHIDKECLIAAATHLHPFHGQHQHYRQSIGPICHRNGPDESSMQTGPLWHQTFTCSLALLICFHCTLFTTQPNIFFKCIYLSASSWILTKYSTTLHHYHIIIYSRKSKLTKQHEDTELG